MRKESMNAIVKLTDEQKKKLMKEIEGFFRDEYGEEIGIIRQQDNLEADYYALYRENR